MSAQQPDDDARFMRRKTVLSSERVALTALADRDHTPETLAEEMGWRVSTARQHLEALEKRGHARFIGNEDLPGCEWFAIVPMAVLRAHALDWRDVLKTGKMRGFFQELEEIAEGYPKPSLRKGRTR